MTARRAHDGAQDFNMRTASAKIVAQRFHRFALARLLVAKQQCFGGHDHAVEAVAALRGLLLDERILHRIWMVSLAMVAP